MDSRRILVTGAAGFIGFHTAKALCNLGVFVIGLDNFNDYYDPSLKRSRAKILQEMGVEVVEEDINSEEAIIQIIDNKNITNIIHLAAQAGCRFSITNPEAYIHSNLNGFLHILEAVKARPHIQLVYASSSSVYGLNKKIPFSLQDPTDNQANFYGVTKKSNELMAGTYHHLFNLSLVGLRFFTVYGPWGRPDMAYFLFTEAIYKQKQIDLFNFGNMRRDFTYVDDIVRGILASIAIRGGHYIFNLGNEHPEPIIKLVQIIEKTAGIKALIQYLPMPLGEIEETFADIKEAKEILGFSPKTTLEEGMGHFLEWHTSYYS